jgi:hypothetical protein
VLSGQVGVRPPPPYDRPVADEPSPRCSAKGCHAPAAWQLRWNNPKLHAPERRKTWLACAGHRESLGAFLSARGFLREVTPFPTASGASIS